MTTPSHGVSPDVATAVLRLIRRRLPLGHHAILVAEDVSIGPEGLGLDSVGTVELLLECEEECGVTIAPELLGRGQLTVGALMRLVMQARTQAGPGPP